MKPGILLLIVCTVAYTTQAQTSNPFKAINKKANIVTLSDGKYVESFDDDVYQRLGSVVIDTRTKKVVKMISNDSLVTLASDNTTASRWLSLDPLAKKYPSLSPYNFCADNPIIFTDPNGKELHIAGKVALDDIRSLVPKQYASQIEVVGDKIVFNHFNDLPDNVKNYQGIGLVNDLINSKNSYKYTSGDEALGVSRTNGKEYKMELNEAQKVTPFSAIRNFSKTSRSDYPMDDQANFLPEPGFDGSVTIRDGEFGRKSAISGDGNFPVSRNTVIFHELDENYERTENGKDYKDAHNASSGRGSKFSKEVNGKSDANAGSADYFTPNPAVTK